jgi:ABC-2 type transport system permease protein
MTAFARTISPMWPLRLSLARLRPFDAAAAIKATIVGLLVTAMLAGDYLLCRRVLKAAAAIEPLTPIIAFALLRGLLSLLLLVSVSALFSSSLTSAIGSFFTDLDLETYHAAPVSRTRLVLARWGKTLVQAGAIVFVFLLPLIAAFGRQYGTPWTFYVLSVIDLLLLLSIPVSLASLLIVVMVRFFPVRRVHQIVATLGVLVLVVIVVGFRMSRPERFFHELGAADVKSILKMIDLPGMDRYPTSWMATAIVEGAHDRNAPLLVRGYVVLAGGSLALFLVVVRAIYFKAYVRARETLAPVALGSSRLIALVDRILVHLDPVTRALVGKELRVLTRDVAQWSQLFLMIALLFLYLYNVQMLPLQGDARATLVAYANLAFSGFIVAAICLRFAYPSLSAEGRAVWLLQSAPISWRRLLVAKVVVYGIPLIGLSLVLTAAANILLDAGSTVWVATMVASLLVGLTLVSLGVALGSLSPQFNAENALQVGLSLGGFGYMASALLYVGLVLFLTARPAQEGFLYAAFRIDASRTMAARLAGPAAAVALSLILSILPLEFAARRLDSTLRK